jgi:hypothetical protein
MHVEIGAEAALFPEKEYISGILLTVQYKLTETDYDVGFFPLKGQCTRFFASDFFHESSSPKFLK